MPIFILKDHSGDRKGFFGGVDFHGGRGSTNSIDDAFRLHQMWGTEVSIVSVNGEVKPVKITEQKRKDGVSYLSFEVLELEKEETKEGAADAAPLPIPEQTPNPAPIETPKPKRGRPKK